MQKLRKEDSPTAGRIPRQRMKPDQEQTCPRSDAGPSSVTAPNHKKSRICRRSESRHVPVCESVSSGLDAPSGNPNRNASDKRKIR